MKRTIDLLVMTFIFFYAAGSASVLEGFKSFNFTRIRGVIVDNRDFNDDNDDSQNNFDQVLESIDTYEPTKGYALGWWVKVGEGTWGSDFGQETTHRKQIKTTSLKSRPCTSKSTRKNSGLIST